LLPTDIEASSESEIEKTAYALSDITDKLNEAKASFALVMVDACRDNPIRSKGRSVGNNRGLSPIDPPKGQIVIFSASKGQQALDRLNDGDSNPNGIFTREFIKRMKQPGVKVEDMVREVQDSVEELARTVSHEQRPAMYSEARGSFYFYGPTSVQILQSNGTASDPDAETWAVALRVNSIISYQAYLGSYPQGRYVAAAQIALAGFKQATTQNTASVSNNKPISALPTRPEDAETAFWSEVKNNSSREYLSAYVKQYPKGKYLVLAKLELKKLDDKDQAELNRQADEEAFRLRQAKEEALRVRLAKEAEIQREEAEAWSKADAATSIDEIQTYLDKFPGGLNVVQASRKLAQLKADAAVLKPGKVFKDCNDCPEMVVLQEGVFTMGSNKNPNEQPTHAVGIKRFAIGKTEVTQGQWKAIMGLNPSRFSSCGSNCPVEQVTWHGLGNFLFKLNELTGKEYRLPSEAEWEYACRAGGNQTFCGSDTADGVAVSWSNSGGKTQPVAGKQPNNWGLFDMSGNVWEWTNDCWSENHTGAPSDGSARLEGACGHLVVRGGAWDSRLNSILRSSGAAGYVTGKVSSRVEGIGFRLARDVP
jgi:formylglycine-generating enzyme required for sulfatase activity